MFIWNARIEAYCISYCFHMSDIHNRKIMQNKTKTQLSNSSALQCLYIVKCATHCCEINDLIGHKTCSRTMMHMQLLTYFCINCKKTAKTKSTMQVWGQLKLVAKVNKTIEQACRHIYHINVTSILSFSNSTLNVMSYTSGHQCAMELQAPTKNFQFLFPHPPRQLKLLVQLGACLLYTSLDHKVINVKEFSVIWKYFTQETILCNADQLVSKYLYRTVVRNQ